MNSTKLKVYEVPETSISIIRYEYNLVLTGGGGGGDLNDHDEETQEYPPCIDEIFHF